MTPKVLTNSYDLQSRVISQTDFYSNTLQFEYLAASTRLTDTLGVVTVYSNTTNMINGTSRASSSPQSWTYTYKPGTTWVESGIDPQGNTWRYTWDNQGNNTSVTDPLTNTTTYTYTNITLSTGVVLPFLTKERDALGRTNLYEFNSAGLPTVITNTVGQTMTIEYNSANRIIRRVDAGGVAECIEYDSYGNVSASIQNCVAGWPATASQNVRTEYGYDVLGRMLWKRSPVGAVTRIFYDSRGNVTKTVTGCVVSGTPSTSSCDAFSNSTPSINRTTQYGYDSYNRPVVMTDTLGVVTRNDYDSAGRPYRVIRNYDPLQAASATTNVTTTLQYDSHSRVSAQVDPVGRSLRLGYDSTGRVSTQVSNYVDGDPTTGAGDSDLVQKLQYDSTDRPITTTINYVDGVWDSAHPDQDRAQVTRYDAVGRVSKVIQNYVDGASSSGEPDTDLITEYTNDAVGNIVAVTDPQGRVTVVEYDGLNRPTALVRNCTDGSGNPLMSGCSSGHGSNNDRNIRSEISYTTKGQVATSTDALGRVTDLTYDPLGRLTQQVGNSGGGVSPADATTSWAYSLTSGIGYTRTMTNALGYASTWQYDQLGQLTSLTDPTSRAISMTYDGLGRKAAQTDALSHTTRYLYYPLGQISKVVANWQNGVVEVGDGSDEDLITQYVYDAAGRTTAVIGSDGKIRAYTYNGLGYLSTATENSGGAVSPSNVTTSYGYNRLGELLSITDPLSHTSTRTYSGVGQLASKTDALTRTTTYSYDRAGNLLTSTDPRVITVTYGYDGLDRAIGVSASSNLTTPITLAYDVASRPSTMTDETGTTIFGYDGLDAMTTSAHSVDGTVTYGRDSLSQLTSLATNNGAPSVGYSYDQAGRLTSVSRDGSSHASATYDAIGRLASLSYAVGVTTTYSYDDADRLTRLLTQDTGSNTKTDFQYTLNRAGLVVSASDAITSTTRTTAYNYDGLQRLVGASESPGTVFTYTYDLAGNRTQVQENSSTTQSLTYDAANQISTSGYSYDGAGNLLADGTSTYTYNALRQMTSASKSGSTYSYLYSGAGVAASESVGGVATRYTLDLSSSLPERLGTTTSGTSTWFIRGWGQELSRESGGSISVWYLADKLGSTRAALASGGSVTAGYWYDPYGAPESLGNTPMDYGFTGEPQTTALGLLDLRARHYSTQGGRFLGQDSFSGWPILPSSLQLYTYGYDNPTNNIDPSGHTPEDGDRTYNSCLEGYIGACYSEFAAYGIEVQSDGKDWTVTELLWVLDGIRQWQRRSSWSTEDFRYAFTGVRSEFSDGPKLILKREADKWAPESNPKKNEYIAARTSSDGWGNYIVKMYGLAFSPLDITGGSACLAVATISSHEFGHVWDKRQDRRISAEFTERTGGSNGWFRLSYVAGVTKNVAGQIIDQPVLGTSTSAEEDLADSISAYLYPLIPEFNDAATSTSIFSRQLRMGFIYAKLHSSP